MATQNERDRFYAGCVGSSLSPAEVMVWRTLPNVSYPLRGRCRCGKEVALTSANMLREHRPLDPSYRRDAQEA